MNTFRNGHFSSFAKSLKDVFLYFQFNKIAHIFELIYFYLKCQSEQLTLILIQFDEIMLMLSFGWKEIWICSFLISPEIGNVNKVICLSSNKTRAHSEISTVLILTSLHSAFLDRHLQNLCCDHFYNRNQKVHVVTQFTCSLKCFICS